MSIYFTKTLPFFLQNNQTLKVLRLNGNKIGNAGGMAFAQALQINTTLKSLDIGDTDLVSKCSNGSISLF